MKKKHLILATVLALPLTVSAMPNASQFQKDLALTPEQKAKLDTIFKAQQEKFRAIGQETNAQVKEVLTQEQNKKWEAMRQQLMERQREIIQQRQNQQK